MSVSAAILWSLLSIAATPDEGAIDGIVVNLSRGGEAAAAVEVELRAELDGELVPLARTRTDEHGKFIFRGVPLDRTMTYVAGANLDGVHYASSKFELGSQRRSAHVRLSVREAVAETNPLVVRRHEVIIEPAMGVLHVTEALLIDNPTAKTFVGKASGDAPVPVTLALGIPTNFERLTFEEEYYGRNFALIGGRVVTSVPWEPGMRWVRFTYSARNEKAYRRWERRIDAPCEKISVQVQGGNADGIECSLPRLDTGGEDRPVFNSSGRTLAAGELVWIGLGDLPVPWTAYARWSAVALLVAIVVGLSLWMRRRREAEQGRPTSHDAPHAKHSHNRRRAA